MCSPVPYRGGPGPGGSGHCGRSRRPPEPQPGSVRDARLRSVRDERPRSAAGAAREPARVEGLSRRASARREVAAGRTCPGCPCLPCRLPGIPLSPASPSRGRPHCVGGAARSVRGRPARGQRASLPPPPAPAPGSPALPSPELHQTALRFLLILQRQEMARVCSSLLCIQQRSRSCRTRPAPASSCLQRCCCCRDEPTPTPGMRLQGCGALTSPPPPLPSARLLFQLS